MKTRALWYFLAVSCLIQAFTKAQDDTTAPYDLLENENQSFESEGGDESSIEDNNQDGAEEEPSDQISQPQLEPITTGDQDEINENGTQDEDSLNIDEQQNQSTTVSDDIKPDLNNSEPLPDQIINNKVSDSEMGSENKSNDDAVEEKVEAIDQNILDNQDDSNIGDDEIDANMGDDEESENNNKEDQSSSLSNDTQSETNDSLTEFKTLNNEPSGEVGDESTVKENDEEILNENAEPLDQTSQPDIELNISGDQVSDDLNVSHNEDDSTIGHDEKDTDIKDDDEIDSKTENNQEVPSPALNFDIESEIKQSELSTENKILDNDRTDIEGSDNSSMLHSISIPEGGNVDSIEENKDQTTKLHAELLPEIEEEQSSDNNIQEIKCPKPCLCSFEGEESNFVVNCAGYSLTELPKPIDSRTSILNLNNNKLTEIPRDIASLKNLKVLNANNNSIMELAAGSISELPELMTLQLANNRLIEFPQDLKNSMSLTKLEELDLGGNDIRTNITPELFSSLTSLRKITLPSSSSSLVEDLCKLQSSLATVCENSCKNNNIECSDLLSEISKNALQEPTLPGMIPFNTQLWEGKVDVVTKNNDTNTSTLQVPTTNEFPAATASTTEFSLRSAVNEEPIDTKAFNSLVEAPTETEPTQPDVKIGANTAQTPKSGGGVDKSVIGIVIAAMIVIVAVITIKKNWSSIKKKFSSTPRPNERTPALNGNAPEEIPLKEKVNDNPV